MSGQTKRFAFLCSSFLFLTYAGLAQDLALDAANASSSQSAGDLGGPPAFAAQQASSGGSRYCNDSLTLASRAVLGNSACMY